jgi:8-oxo-dGTP diphosphatase
MILTNKPLDFSPRFEVVGCFCEHKGKVLFLQRPADKPQGNTWNVPAGKIEENESPEQAIIREVKEEAGVSISDKKLQRIREYWIRYKEYDYIYYTFRVPVHPDDCTIDPKEAQAYGWYTPEKALLLNLIEDEDICIKDAYGMAT